jgi:hypothetical protein
MSGSRTNFVAVSIRSCQSVSRKPSDDIEIDSRAASLRGAIKEFLQMASLPAFVKMVIFAEKIVLSNTSKPKRSRQSFSRSTKMRLPQTSAPWMTVVYLTAVATAHANNNPIINVGDETTPTSDGTTLFTPTRTTFPRINSLSNPFDSATTAAPGVVSINQGDQHIQQGPHGVKTVINGDQTIIDGPSGRTVINGDQTIIQTRGSSGGQTMIQIDEESTGGATLATGIPIAGAMMVAGGAMMLI